MSVNGIVQSGKRQFLVKRITFCSSRHYPHSCEGMRWARRSIARDCRQQTTLYVCTCQKYDCTSCKHSITDAAVLAEVDRRTSVLDKFQERLDEKEGYRNKIKDVIQNVHDNGGTECEVFLARELNKHVFTLKWERSE